MTILERPLYNRISISTAPWSTPITWTDQTASLVSGISYSEGGRMGTPGSSPVDSGTLTATFKDLSTVPVVGSLIKLFRTGTSELIFTGYVQDVSQRIVFANNKSLSTPVTLTTLYCGDWVTYVSQFQAIGVGGAARTTGIDNTTSVYYWENRVAALNKIIDPTYSTLMISGTRVSDTQYIGDSDQSSSVASHLDLLSATTDVVWYGKHVIPTDKTTGRTGLVEVYERPLINGTGASASGKTFTDVAGSAGQLHYTEIDFENSSTNVANTVIAQNRARFYVPDVEVTKIGGFNENNYVLINNTQVTGIALDVTQQASDATSITTYGNRQAEISTNASTYTQLYGVSPNQYGAHNLVANPSVEYSDDGYTSVGSAVTVLRRRKPSEDTLPLAAYTGQWAMRARIKTAGLQAEIQYIGGETDGIPVVAGNSYNFTAKVARSASPTDTRARAVIRFFDADEVLTAAYTSTLWTALTNAQQWYEVTTQVMSAPANSVRASVAVQFSRTGGTNLAVGGHYWADAFHVQRSNSLPYFDGDTPWDTNWGYLWTGGVGASPSYRVVNTVDDVAAALVTRYSTTSMRATRIRWNAQEDLTAISALAVGKSISLTYKGTTNYHRIIGIDGNIDPDRYMIDYYLAKV